MDCKLLTCDEEATVPVTHPYGRSNLCREHVDALNADDRETWRALELACRYGPVSDPDITEVERGHEYARPNGLRVA